MDADTVAAASSFRVTRKPVASSQSRPANAPASVTYLTASVQTSGLTINTTARGENKPDEDLRPPLPPRSRTSSPAPTASPGWAVKGSSSFGPYVTSPSTLSPSLSPLTLRQQTRSPSPSPSNPISTPVTPSTFQTLTTTRDFALNLLPQNTTSTKHYTILLHSSPLIIYRGPKTSITLTIFSSPSHPLPSPESRTLHLQQRGLSGDTGARLKALVGFTDSWIDVTPALRVLSPTDVDPAIWSRWEQDIARATKRLAKQAGKCEARVARETHVVRIPAAADDGYFRVVVCHSETSGDKQRHKVLCAGPMLRIASLSSDAAVFRGATLRTLPLEAGIQVATIFASNTVGRAVGPVVQAVQDKVEKYKPGFTATTAGELAYGATLEDKVHKVGERVDERYRTYAPEDGSGRDLLDVIGSDEGPRSPFPIRIQGRVVRGTGKGTEMLGIPTANLGDVPGDIKFRLKGVYFGWARILDTKGVDHLSQDWHEAIISVGPSPYASPSVLAKTVFAVHMVHNFDEVFYDAKLQVIVMGFLRPMKAAGTATEELLDAVSQDLWLTMSSLSRQNWGPDVAAERIKTLKSARSFSDKYVHVREKVQTHIDRIPAHWVGVRTAGGELRDQVHGNGGYWIAR
jgi:hypothetical protein